MEKDDKLCNCRKTIKNGRDRQGNQRYKCVKCGKTHTDGRRLNNYSHACFTRSRDMLIDWLDGHSYRTLARNYDTTTYHVHSLIHRLVECLPDFRKLVFNHTDRFFVTAAGLDAGYIATNKGKVCFLLAVCLDTNTVLHFKRVTGETLDEVTNFLFELKDCFPNLEYLTTDLARAYPGAVGSANCREKELFGEDSVEITHILCRVHMFMTLRNQRHGLNLTLTHRKYRVPSLLIQWENAFRNFIINTSDEISYDLNLANCKSLEAINDKFTKAVAYIERKWKQHLIQQYPRAYRTNNLVESNWNLIKTKSKTARSLGNSQIDEWINLMILRYHYNHIKETGTVVDNGKRFQDFQYLTFRTFINSLEPRYLEES